MTIQNEIKGIMVTFFREASKEDYLEALNRATDEMFALMEAQKLKQPVVSSKKMLPKKIKKKHFLAVCRNCDGTGIDDFNGRDYNCMHCEGTGKAN